MFSDFIRGPISLINQMEPFHMLSNCVTVRMNHSRSVEYSSGIVSSCLQSIIKFSSEMFTMLFPSIFQRSALVGYTEQRKLNVCLHFCRSASYSPVLYLISAVIITLVYSTSHYEAFVSMATVINLGKFPVFAVNFAM